MYIAVARWSTSSITTASPTKPQHFYAPAYLCKTRLMYRP
jgi:hypothetical protein